MSCKKHVFEEVDDIFKCVDCTLKFDVIDEEAGCDSDDYPEISNQPFFKSPSNLDGEMNVVSNVKLSQEEVDVAFDFYNTSMNTSMEE